MRDGWVRLRWPTRSALARPSLLVRFCSADCSPASQMKLMALALSRTSSCSVSMALFLCGGAGQYAMDDGRIGFGGQRVPDVGIGHEPGNFGQQFKVGLRGRFRDQQDEQQIGRAAV